VVEDEGAALANMKAGQQALDPMIVVSEAEAALGDTNDGDGAHLDLVGRNGDDAVETVEGRAENVATREQHFDKTVVESKTILTTWEEDEST
jgi:hypothetical protein